MHWSYLYIILAWAICAAMVPVVLRRQLAPGASLAWLGIVFLHPYVGLGLYLTVGQNRLDPRRVARYRELLLRYRPRPAGDAPDHAAGASGLESTYQPMILQAQKISGMPILPGNGVEFLTTSPQFIDRFVADIDAAAAHVHLIYFIFAPDDTGQRVETALVKAAARGVKCRVLVDAASIAFFRPLGLQHRLTAAGVQVAAALPVAPIRRRLTRIDLRNHRKLAIIDGRIAYAGSHNIIDPDYGGRRGAPWIDLTGRFVGPVVDELANVFCEDWAVETNEQLDGCAAYDLARTGGATAMQVVPTGPGIPDATYRRVLLAAIQCARKQLILTTPYFVPDEPTLIALLMAADRGVEVKLLIPRNADHRFTAAAGRAHYERLAKGGVSIFLYRPGLLHSKTVTVDDAFAILGTANIDGRSFNLNFELSVLLYGPEVTGCLRAVQAAYLEDCDPLDIRAWAARPAIRRYADDAVSLLSPLL